MSKFQDLTGKCFGHLLVIELTDSYFGESGDIRNVWICECACKRRIDVVVRYLKRGKASCGKCEYPSLIRKIY